MRNLIVLLMCSVLMGAGVAARAADAHGADTPKADAEKAASKPLIALPPKPGPASPMAVAATPATGGARNQMSRAAEDQGEVDLSAKIAARLAEMRAAQAARATQAARARKVAAHAVPVPVAPPPAHGTQWSYDGELGPANWSKINVDWAKCGSGNRQSPIDIRDGMKVDLEQIAFDYHPSSFNVIDNGHTILVTVGSGNFITVMNNTYELQQFHFHRPSEERINGRSFEMVVHLVHKDSGGHLAVIAVLLERGQAQGLIQTVWNNLPLEKNQLVVPSIVLNPADMLPARHDYYTYMGSMTTPPCSEDVLWMVMKQPVQASPAQMALFSRLYPLNARPVQASAGRIIKESN